MVGGGALGFDIVKGFRQSEYIGRGLAAGLTIVLLGIMLDRVTGYGARRTGAGAQPARTQSARRWVMAGRRARPASSQA
jgi:glycine betaine/proline transport system permease protein